MTETPGNDPPLKKMHPILALFSARHHDGPRLIAHLPAAHLPGHSPTISDIAGKWSQ
jgi:hypothetical protein